MSKLVIKDLPREEIVIDSNISVKIVGGATGIGSGGSTSDTIGADGLSHYNGSSSPGDQKIPTGGWWENFFGVGDTGWSTL